MGGMLELIKNEDRQRAAAEVRAKQESLFKTNVSVGECLRCPLRIHCEFVNEKDTTCRVTSVAIAQFEQHALKSPWVHPEDALTIRNLGAIWASIILAELYLRHYGAIIIKTSHGARQMSFSDMHKDYIKLLSVFQEKLAEVGLSPMGRKQLRSGDNSPGGGGSLLEAYLEVKNKDNAANVVKEDLEIVDTISDSEANEESSGSSGHSDILPRSATPRFPIVGDSGGTAESDVCTPDEPVTETPLSRYDWRGGATEKKNTISRNGAHSRRKVGKK